MKSKTSRPWTYLPKVAVLCFSLLSPIALMGQLVGDDSASGSSQVISSPESIQQNTNSDWQGFPLTANTPEETMILVSKEVPREVRPGIEYTYKIMVTNNSSFQIDKVVLTERIPSNFSYSSASPEPEVRDAFLRFEFDALAPRQVEVITVTGSTAGPGEVNHMNDTNLDFGIGPLTSITSVVEPKLGFIVEAPADSIIGDVVPVKLTFRNSGSAPVYDAYLSQVLPDGLLTDDNQDRFDLNIGNLFPGDIKIFDIALLSTSTGSYQVDMLATARDGITANAVLETDVLKPSLSIVAQAPTMRFVGNTIVSEIAVTNNGDGQARNTVLTQYLAAGTEFRTADEGGALQDNTVVWNIGSLLPGETKNVTSRVATDNIMTVRTSAVADAHAADSVEGIMVTDVQGVAAIKLRLGDINDPVPVGDNEVYVVQVDNQGSLAGTGIRLKCILEEGMEYVSASGPAEAMVEGNTVVFDSVPVLAPGAVAEWRIVIKARKAGDVRFTAVVETDQLTEPVEENEATNFYN
ncbi:MAG: DUF11 domain-containing protein [Opitutales bacterium]|nr:DUF11 domain-containing protein [Opitutales bacterium]